MNLTTQVKNVKPLRSLSIKPEYADVQNLPIVENKEKREEILKRALKKYSRA
ncbi:hypothetical protein [Terribacillus sp. 7520-G]|uniref:hypothetical protein n=1 Tax=Terribacillus sp. 7520-G TaxID=2025389 RepID=UPI0013043C96|nr:hypothetical protein [Terribacillus sp. 7520-G]